MYKILIAISLILVSINAHADRLQIQLPRVTITYSGVSDYTVWVPHGVNTAFTATSSVRTDSVYTDLKGTYDWTVTVKGGVDNRAFTNCTLLSIDTSKDYFVTLNCPD